MIVLLSCAKTMSDSSKIIAPFETTPRFQQEASEIALQMSQFSVEELERVLRVNSKIAVENYKRYQGFHAEGTPELPAFLAYSGIVFKRLNPRDFSIDEFYYAQEHLRLTSFCYGLLRPLDVIRLYRLEGDVVLPELGNQNLFTYWRSRLTDVFIDDIKKGGGVLCNLASDEMKGLFDWKQVEKEVCVMTPEFHVWKNGKLATVVVYTKMCRGEMARCILKNKIEDLEELKSFSWEGFEFDESLSDEKQYVFVNGKEK
ncbi:peroxide stress protein YaaA [Bacteroides sp.]|uniref:peroxide stress protein YaaA n=1 Tax=Bacteroides sp. TaxID=29523 RepID=UPI0026220A87|nr:peroxide stress protein YaaA [Bacteroides sp.]MDD3039434.1 peroxide stress protein YaaA [Bacteroides sp.]